MECIYRWWRESLGLLRGDLRVQSDDELAAILAHEIAHVTARHVSESGGKSLITNLADKKLKNEVYKRSFNTVQENEADKFSVIYSALAGYNPLAAVSVWQRMHNHSGSNHGSLLHTHPLNDDRAQNMRNYGQLAKQYYQPNIINAQHDFLLRNNAVFSNQKKFKRKSGEGGGFLALLETAANTYTEVLETKLEQSKRQSKQYDQERIASTQLLFQQLQVADAQGGGQGLFGYAVNATGKVINNARLSIKYWSGQNVIYEDEMNIDWVAMRPYERRHFGILLKQIRYTSVTISSKYVQFAQ